MSETPPRGLPGRRNANPPAPIDTPSPGERNAPTPLVTPPEERDSASTGSTSSVGDIITSPPITPPGRGPPLPTGEAVDTDHWTTPPDRSLLLSVEIKIEKSPQATPPPSSPLGPEGKELPTETINEQVNRPKRRFDRKLEKEDYDEIFQMIDKLDHRSRGPKRQEKGRFSHLPPSQIRHVKGGGPGNIVMAPDEDFVIRLIQFPPHADGPQLDEYFDYLFGEANNIALHFVLDNFGGFDIKPGESEWKHPWNEIDVSPLFIGLAELVEDTDPDDPRSWDSLLYDESKRAMMIMGMIARIFIDEIFSPLLFGCTPNQASMLNALEEDMAENSSLDGFARTKTRSRAIREVLDGKVLPTNFFDEVEILSLNIFGLLSPVSAYLEKYRRQHNLDFPVPNREEQFASLFDMVSGTAWLSICCRVHPEPIILRMSEPGDEFNEDFDECANYNEYCENKARVLKLQYDRLGEEIEHVLHGQEDESVEDLPESEILKERMWLVKTAVWPSVKIYSPVYGDEAGAESGVSEYTVQKCEVAAQWVVPPIDRESTIPSLREWAELT
ncbi:hypothetical protein VE03_04971 [Pseudogymnoascus sp. 23342-1-I1]|nr:hypothetical protein VE03_04971 [Pseudogymnoascus sp. 23342-1-I1]